MNKLFDDVSWGNYPDNWVEDLKEIEESLIDLWREYNSNYLHGKNLVRESKSDEMIEYGNRIINECKRKMEIICKILNWIRTIK